VDDPRIDGPTLLVVDALHRHMSADGVCWVGLRRLAQFARCAVGTVRRRLEVLADAGLLESQRDGQARTIYRAVLSPVLAEVTVEAITAAPAGVSPGSAGVSPGDTRSPEPPADLSSSCVSRDGMHSPTTTGRQPPARD